MLRTPDSFAAHGTASRQGQGRNLPVGDVGNRKVAALLACFLLGLTLVVVRRIAGSTGFIVIPRRWVVERSLGWLGRWRRLSKDYEQLPEVSEARVTLAMIRLMLHRLVHPNRKCLPAP
jgi:putative transposase